MRGFPNAWNYFCVFRASWWRFCFCVASSTGGRGSELFTLVPGVGSLAIARRDRVCCVLPIFVSVVHILCCAGWARCLAGMHSLPPEGFLNHTMVTATRLGPLKDSESSLLGCLFLASKFTTKFSSRTVRDRNLVVILTIKSELRGSHVL